MCTQLVCLKAGEYSKCLYTSCFLWTCWLKVNRAFLNRQLFIILFQSQVLDSNSQDRTDNNNHLIAKKSETARRKGLLLKAIAICSRKKAGHYCQNNDRNIELLFVGLNQ